MTRVYRWLQALMALYGAYRCLDAELIEINPLAVSAAGDLMALDAKMVIDDNALFRHPDLAALRDDDDLDEVDLSLLVHERELDVLRTLFELPEVLTAACIDRAPHRVTVWVRELAGRFHGFYHDCYVMGDDVAPELTQARLWLVEAAGVGLGIGLDLLGVSAPESM